MTFAISPPAVIFVNDGITANTQAKLEKQLSINETMSGDEFDSRYAADPNYVSIIHGNNLRVLVIRSFMELNNREVADVAIYVKNGLAAVEKNNFGEPILTLPLDNLYLNVLLRNTKS